jgi:type 1 glutamine amidotransferase
MRNVFCRALIALCGVAGLPACPAAPAEEAASEGKIRALVITGGHGYDKPQFEAMFESMKGIEARQAVQPKALNEFAADRRGRFDVVVLYDMWQDINDQQKKDLVDMLKQGKGLVVLHHAIANYQKWDEYPRIFGARYYIEPRKQPADSKIPPISVYRHDVRFRVKVIDKDHPITRGIGDFEIFDELYKYYDVQPGVHLLLGTDHPENEPTLAWTKSYGTSRIVYIQLGHDPYAFRHPNYRELVARAIRWTANRPDGQVATPGFVPSPTALEPTEGPEWIQLFNGKDFDGWEFMGNKDAWQVLPGGIIHSNGGKNGKWLRYAKEEFGNFIIRAEWRISKEGNSGLFIRAKREGNPWETGHEVQALNMPDRDELHCTGSLYGSVPVNPRPDETPERWHEFEVQANGQHFIVIVDQVKVIDAKAADYPELKKRPLRGFIGIQDSHTDAGKWAEWRNVRVKKLGK